MKEYQTATGNLQTAITEFDQAIGDQTRSLVFGIKPNLSEFDLRYLQNVRIETGSRFV